MAQQPQNIDVHMSDQEGDPLLVITSKGVWVSTACENYHLAPPVAGNSNQNGALSPSASPSCSEPNESGNCTLEVQGETRNEALPLNTVPLDELGYRILQQMCNEFDDTKKARMSQPKWVNTCQLEASDFLLKAEKWSTTIINGRKGFFAPFPSQIGSDVTPEKQKQNQ